MVLEKTLESHLDCKEIQPVHLKGDQSWIFIAKSDAKAETPKLWSPDAKNWLSWKDPDAGKDWRQEEKGMDRGWGGWISLSTQWTWVWVNSERWWWTGRPGMRQSMGPQRVGQDWLNWIEYREDVMTDCGWWVGVGGQGLTDGYFLTLQWSDVFVQSSIHVVISPLIE